MPHDTNRQAVRSSLFADDRHVILTTHHSIAYPLHLQERATSTVQLRPGDVTTSRRTHPSAPPPEISFHHYTNTSPTSLRNASPRLPAPPPETQAMPEPHSYRSYLLPMPPVHSFPTPQLEDSQRRGGIPRSWSPPQSFPPNASAVLWGPSSARGRGSSLEGFTLPMPLQLLRMNYLLPRSFEPHFPIKLTFSDTVAPSSLFMYITASTFLDQ